MKKYAFILAAICACLVLSCTKENPKFEEENASPAMKTVTITASIDDVVTKTSYADGTTFSWTKGDQISVYCSDGNFYPFTADETGATSTFTGSIPEGKSLDSQAFFPAADEHTKNNFYLPYEKDLTGHDSADIPMQGTKGEGDTYSFVHCAGAALLTITNIPNGITSATIVIASKHATNPAHNIKLSGLFYINGSETAEPYWSGAYFAAGTNEDKFSRKVKVSNNTAKVYIPCAAGYNNSVPNEITVIGHKGDEDIALVTNKPMKKLGSVARAHVLPLTPLVLSGLDNIDWTAENVATSTLSSSMTAEDKIQLTELKAVADSYFLYMRVKAPSATFNANYLDYYISDGLGENPVVWYWNTTGSNTFSMEHNGVVTNTSLTISYNGKSVSTKTEVVDGNIYWSMALPRSAHPLTSSQGTVYIGFRLLNNWALAGVIPTCWTDMLSVDLP